MRKVFFIALCSIISFTTYSQVTIQMKRDGGVSIVPCKVNGLNLKFIFDTGASEVSISMTEATFMFKNDYLSADDIIGKANYLDANGNISVGVSIILKEIEIGGLKLFNVKASVVNNLKAPLLLGQSAISKLGTVQLDLNANTLTILNFKENALSEETVVNDQVVDTGAVEDKLDHYAMLYQQANEYYDQGNYQQAISNADLILIAKPQSKNALFLRALSYDMLEDYKSAIRDYTKLIGINPNDHIAFCYRGKSKYDMKDYSGALADLNKGLSLNDKYIPGLRWRAETKGMLNNNMGAIQDYDKAISLNPKDSTLFVNRALYKQRINDYTGAIVDCNKALSTNSDYAYAYYRRGVSKKGLKQYQAAMEDLNRSIDLDPELSDAYVIRGLIKEEPYEDYNGALEDYKKAIDLNPNDLLASILKEALEEKIKKNVWIWVGTSLKDEKWFMYNSLASKEYSTIRLWIKTEFKSLTTKKNGRSVTYTNGHTLVLCQFNCADNEYKTLSFTRYDSKGNSISDYEDVEYESWKPIIPGTVMEQAFIKACERYNK